MLPYFPHTTWVLHFEPTNKMSQCAIALAPLTETISQPESCVHQNCHHCPTKHIEKLGKFCPSAVLVTVHTMKVFYFCPLWIFQFSNLLGDKLFHAQPLKFRERLPSAGPACYFCTKYPDISPTFTLPERSAPNRPESTQTLRFDIEHTT